MASSRRRSLVTRVRTLLVVCVAPALCAQDQVEPRFYEFHGELEQTPVQLGGEGLPELFSACTELLRTSGIEPVGELAVEGRRFVRTAGYFDRQEACGFVVLNARPPGPSHFAETPLMTGSVDGIPFRLWDPPEEAAAAVRAYLPMAVRSSALETVIVDGTYYPPRAGAWSVEEVVALIERRLSPSAPPEVAEHRPGGPWRTVADRSVRVLGAPSGAVRARGTRGREAPTGRNGRVARPARAKARASRLNARPSQRRSLPRRPEARGARRGGPRTR